MLKENKKIERKVKNLSQSNLPRKHSINLPRSQFFFENTSQHIFPNSFPLGGSTHPIQAFYLFIFYFLPPSYFDIRDLYNFEEVKTRISKRFFWEKDCFDWVIELNRFHLFFFNILADFSFRLLQRNRRKFISIPKMIILIESKMDENFYTFLLEVAACYFCQRHKLIK